MILKKKIIFGAIGFLVASGAIALTVILATNDNNLPKKTKTKLDVPKLTSNSFEVSGTQTLGIVNLKDDTNLNEQIQLKYFVGSEAPINDKDYTTNKPSTLKNSDIVYIKPFIKKASIASYEFKDKAINPIKFVVSGLPLTTISNSLLIKDSFIVSGTQTQGTIKKKPNVIFPNQIEAKYFKGASAPKLDESYKLRILSDLSNGDKVHIKFFIKKEHITTHQFANNFINLITIQIDTLPKIEVDSSLLVRDSFLISGSQSQGTIKKKVAITLPSEVETKYFKGNEAPEQDSAYESQVPANLSNGENVHIKFFIKSDYIATHKFASGFTNAISIPVSGLKTLIDHRALKTSSFEFVNAPSKTIRWKSGANLPEQLVIKYYKSLSNTRPSSDNDYKTNVPKNLNEGDHIYIKFFIKKERKNTYKFANKFENFIHLEVKNNIFKSIINILNLKTSSFQTSGNNGIGIIQWKDEINLPKEVQIKYAKTTSKPNHNNQYNLATPARLNNGDILYIKFFIKNIFSASHKFPSSAFENPVKFVVKDLKTLVNHRALKESSFEVSGTQGKGTIGWKTNAKAPILPNQVEVRYYRGAVKPNSDSSYKTIPSSALSNNDLVHIKFFIKEEYIKTYKFASDFNNYIPFTINTLAKNEVDTTSLVSSSFKATGIPGAGMIKLKGSVALPKEVEVKYYRAGSKPSGDSQYSSTIPTNLSNGDNIHIKFFIKDAFNALYKLPTSSFNNYILFVVRNLRTPILNNGKNVFQDSNGNIWALGHRIPLQVLKKEDVGFASSWINNTSQDELLNGSNITDGENGVIFEDSSGNIWAMGSSVPLQVLKKTSTGFASSWINNTNQPGLLNGSNITNGENGIIFEDSSGNIWAMAKGTPLQVLKKEGKNFARSWINNTNQPGLLNGSNITNGENGIIFEDSSGNIWAMAKGTPLQVLKKEGKNFARSWINNTNQPGLLNGSNITNGENGIIFEDSSGNIWAMAKGTPLQVLKKEGKNFVSSWINNTNQPGLLNGSNITNGENGIIFEDSSGNIWAMAKGTPLQVLKKEGDNFARSWINDPTQPGLLNGSNITNGENGIIFEDSYGNIWAMAKGTPLQVLKKEGDNFARSWINDPTQPGLLNGSNITNGKNGIIFEDSSGSIWAKGFRTKLQVLKKEGEDFAHSWKSVTSSKFLLNGSNIVDGHYGVIFEDSSGNIWAMGNRKPLQVLTKKNDGTYASSWTSDTSRGLLKGSNIIDGGRGTIFEDSSGNIWAMGYATRLQVLKKEGANFASSWTSDISSGLLKGSNIKYGFNGTIFEDSSGNIWSMGYQTPLQVLKKEGSNFASSWTSDTSRGLLNGSNITDGNGGVIFEDSSGNLWAMGKGTPLQVLQKEGSRFANSWINDPTQPGLLNGSNIIDGYSATILEDSYGNIWAMGARTPLQVLQKEGEGFANSWINDPTQPGLLNGSKITNGWHGAMFKDSNGNIWAMGYWAPLQVLRKEDSGFAGSWINSRTKPGLLKSSNIAYGAEGTIFEDSSGNIWAMGFKKPLQVLKKEGEKFASSWASDTSSGLLSGSNITDGRDGVIFQDSSGNIWAMGKGTPLQVLRKANGGFA